jgi:hypothetical protein
MGKPALLSLALVATTLLDCGPDRSVASCPPESEAREVEALGATAVVRPWVSSKEELLPAQLWQGINPSISRSDMEALLAADLRVRNPYWSEFETPLGRLRWSLDREYSGGDEAKVPRIYLYPRRLTLSQIFSVSSLKCLRSVAPEARDIVVMSRSGDQLATLVVDGLTVEQIIWRQTPL